jgi:pyruvate dehydrogenase E2 component (dihydrolipoamide acetyltransferase)
MTEVVLPELGENVEKGDVVRLLVKVGDTIAVDQPLVELETDKATIEVPSTVAGKVTAVNVKPGDKVKVGQKLISVDTGAAEPAAKAERATKGEPAAKDVPKSPAAEAALTEKAEAPQEPPQPEPAPPQPAAASKPASKPAAVVNISRGRAAVAQAAAVAPVSPAGDIAAAPSVRRYARELGVNIADVRGSGPGGRIAIEDVTAYVKSVMTGGGARPGGAAVRQPPLPDFSKWGAIDVKPMSNIRRKTAEHLTAAWQAPHVTQHDKADVSAVEEFRKLQGSRVEKEGGKLTVTAIVIKIAALAIDKFPQFASSVDMANESIIYKNYCHIGVAVDTPNGLLVPVIRDVDKKSITEISIELATLSQKARDKKLSLDEMSGGVFSVTNLGGIGGTSFTPIVNMPEVAILGLSRTQTEPVWQNDQFVPKPMLPLSLSYDHRVIDGADAARFLRFVADALEQPLSLYL